MYYMGFYAEISGVEPLNVSFRTSERQTPSMPEPQKERHDR